MLQNSGQLSTTRTTQVWAGAACLVVFIFLIFGHLMTLRDRTMVTTAIHDANSFRSALAAYEVDYGSFPKDTVANPYEFARGLHDPRGRPYMHLPTDREVVDFSYTPDSDGQGYTLVLRARDRRNTPVVANPVRTLARPEG